MTLQNNYSVHTQITIKLIPGGAGKQNFAKKKTTFSANAETLCKAII